MIRGAVLATLLPLAASANATSPVPPSGATAEDYALAEKLKVAISHGDLREAQRLFSDNLTILQGGLIVRESKAAAIYAMNHGGEGVWKFECKPPRVDRVSVSRYQIIALISFARVPACNYPEKSDQIQIYDLAGSNMISKIYFWSLNG